MVISGDVTQTDLPSGKQSGLRDALERLQGIPGIAQVRMQAEDIVRNPLVNQIVRAYEQQPVSQQRQGDSDGRGVPAQRSQGQQDS